MDINVLIMTMLKLFLILCLGFILNKTGVFDEYVNKKISSLVVNLTSPLLIIASVSGIESSNRSAILVLVGVGFLMYFAFIILGRITTTILPFPKKDRRVYECMSVFPNSAFMGYPVLQSVLGEASIFYASMMHMAFSFIIYTYGVMCLNTKEDTKVSLNPKQLLTPGFILCMLALVIYLFNIHLPSLIVETCSMVGSVTSPLSMMMIGSSLALYPLRKSLSDWHSYLFAAVRLLLIPSVTALVCFLLKLDVRFPMYASVAIITNGMPVASTVLMFAVQYDANKEVVTRNIVVTTLLSVITIPIIVSLFVL